MSLLLTLIIFSLAGKVRKHGRTQWQVLDIFQNNFTNEQAVSLFHSLLIFYFSFYYFGIYTAQEMKFSIQDFFTKCDQIHRFLRNLSHLVKISLMNTSFFVQCECIENSFGEIWNFFVMTAISNALCILKKNTK